MSTLEVVILSVLSGAFALAAAGGLAILIWIAWTLRKTLQVSQAENRELRSKIEQLLEGNKQETKAAFESAKSSFQSIKSETSRVLDLHRDAMKEVVSRINADAIVQNVNKFVSVCVKLETAISAFQKLLLDNSEVDRGTNVYGPEDTAPERSEFGGPPSLFSIGQSAQYDAESEREAALEVTSQSAGTD